MRTHLNAPMALLGSSLVIGAFASSGCFIQNKIVYPAPADTVSGLYATQPVSVVYSETLRNTLSQQDGSVSALPDLVANIFTNPVAIGLSAPGSNSGYLASPYPSSSGTGNLEIPITYSAIAKSISASATPGSATDAWGTDSSCLLQTFITITGNLDPLGTTASTISIQGASVSLNGRFSGKVTVSLLIADMTDALTCATALQKISACYGNLTDCDSTSGSAVDNQTIQAGYQAYFGPWVDAQVLTAAEIAQLTPDLENGSLSYEIQYQ
ncbi:MAG: hypothetical protein P4M08_07835 [Oligoflexia bacterium]|nr:hypothetical protein [Oligoflexia bacterium]